ncbi:ABC transporter substrate-binding protein [Rhodococcus sovatensis]|uniref:ABC transporter substrate-binding protein n=1 Tax=Rhodococcus sovatensis TaxID=1805840 RepID=A0ABZ2PPN6_9NOCA
MKNATVLRRTTLLMAALSTAVALVGCGSGPAEDASATTSTAGSGDTFPVTIESTLGSATIESAPTRIATWGWSNQDALLALGVVPAAMPSFVGETYGADAEGVLTWDRQTLDDLGAPTPTLFEGDGTGEVPVEKFAEVAPDVIFAPYSGITQEEFDALSEIAPVVAYPDQPWTASWEEQLTIAGQVLGKQSDAAALVDATEQEIADVAAEYPALKGKTITLTLPSGPGVFSVSKSHDVRIEFLEQLGLVNEESIQEADPKKDDDAVYFELSYEQAPLIASDLMFVVAYDKPSLAAFLAEPLVAEQPVVSGGRTASTESFTADKNFAFGGLTVLTIPYILDDVAAALNTAAENVG